MRWRRSRPAPTRCCSTTWISTRSARWPAARIACCSRCRAACVSRTCAASPRAACTASRSARSPTRRLPRTSRSRSPETQERPARRRTCRVTPGPARVPVSRRAGGPTAPPPPRPRPTPGRPRTRWLGRPLHCLEETDSTMRVAQELARPGRAAGTAVVAEAQTAGRGRLGRSFYSPALPESLRHLGAASPDERIGGAGLRAGRCGRGGRGGRRHGRRRATVEIKWPNDVLLGGLKVAGHPARARLRRGRASPTW